MKNKIVVALVFWGLLFLTSCAKNETCTCDNTGNITETDAKDVWVSLNEACDLAKTADATCEVG